MQICRICVLNESFPGISFDGNGICNFCFRSKAKNDRVGLKARYQKKFADLIKEFRGKNSYDCLVAFSGGKDSTYTLDLMKNEYKLNVLAFSFNNWFQSETAINNINNVLAKIEVDHLTFLPSFLDFKKMINTSIAQDLYALKSLERATSVCTTCLSLIRFACLKIAIEKNIPFVVFGLSPGQAPVATSVFKTNTAMVRKMQDAILYPLHKHVGDDVNRYFLEERHFEKKDSFPYSINPLAFTVYDEEKIYQRIQEAGWQPPKDTDANSTNCLLNGFANQVHLEKHGFHPYAVEMAELVREGVLTREEAIRRLSEPADWKIVQEVKGKLGL